MDRFDPVDDRIMLTAEELEKLLAEALALLSSTLGAIRILKELIRLKQKEPTD